MYQRKYSTDVIMCSTKALQSLKNNALLAPPAFMSLNQYGTLFFHFTVCLRFNISYFKHNGIHTPSKPRACFPPVCVSNQHFRQCGVPWDVY